MFDREYILGKIADIARVAGDKILEVYNSEDFSVEYKQDDSPLTKADKLASDYIVGELGKLTDLPIVSEENEVRSADGAYWLVDPLDGTKEFVKRGGDFTVNIALIEGYAPTLGVVYVPVLDKLYVGDTEVPTAYAEDTDGRHKIRAEFSGSVPVVVASKSHRNPETEEFLARLQQHEEESFGSSLKLCTVAEGGAMLYPRMGPTCLWDTAAADAVVRAAGGSVTDIEGNSLRYDINQGKLNPFFVVAARNNSLEWQ